MLLYLGVYVCCCLVVYVVVFPRGKGVCFAQLLKLVLRGRDSSRILNSRGGIPKQNRELPGSVEPSKIGRDSLRRETGRTKISCCPIFPTILINIYIYIYIYIYVHTICLDESCRPIFLTIRVCIYIYIYVFILYVQTKISPRGRLGVAPEACPRPRRCRRRT